MGARHIGLFSIFGAGEGKKTLHQIYSTKTTTYQVMRSKNGQKSVG
jgi:hypothetical protein